MKRGFLKRACAAMLCVSVLLVSQSVPTRAADYKAKISDLNSEIAAIQQAKKELDKEIASTKNEKEKKEKEKATLQNQVYMAQQEIELLSSRIDTLEDNITAKEGEVKQKQTEADLNYDVFKKRMRTMYLNDTASTLGVVFGADSYADFLTRSEMLERTSAHDKDVIDDLLAAKKVIEADLAEIEANKAQVEADKKDMGAQKVTLAGKVEETAEQIQDVELLQRNFEAQKEQKMKEEKEAQAEIKRIYAANASIGDYVGGDFLWPLTGFRTLTSVFGMRFGGSDFHTGIDIAGRSNSGAAAFRQPIHAANTGKVIYASNSYTPGVGYGRYVIIDHGGGMSTLYGHQNQVYVSVGDRVEQGDIIGEVGSTGWSTGPHLHFEIRKNGSPVNPSGYFNI